MKDHVGHFIRGFSSADLQFSVEVQEDDPLQWLRTQVDIDEVDHQVVCATCGYETLTVTDEEMEASEWV